MFVLILDLEICLNIPCDWNLEEYNLCIKNNFLKNLKYMFKDKTRREWIFHLLREYIYSQITVQRLIFV